MIGQTISHYKILEKLGEGGMGEVYLAQDTSLDRKVALKFLPQEMQQDEAARERFLREAKASAALDHPYICQVHEVDEIDGRDFIALEYVQGVTLEDKLRGGPLPLEEALQTAAKIAEAIEAAHQQEIVHRDLKPSNIMITSGGYPKVMDFGVAKRLIPPEEMDDEGRLKLTETGVRVGTLPYMSPEQTRGERVDTRSDIFSFGVVLYEMLTGVQPFQKDSAVETSNAILKETPAPVTNYLDGTPIVLPHTVRKMLAKDPDRRFQLIHDVRTDLEDVISAFADLSDARAEAPSSFAMVRQAGVHSSWRRAIPWAASIVIVAIVALAFWESPTDAPAIRRFSFSPAGGEVGTEVSGMALSPDGDHLVYLGSRPGHQREIYHRPLAQLEAEPLDGTEGAERLFFSPDGSWVGFYSNQEVKKVSLTGGPAVTICAVKNFCGASWGSDGDILFGRYGSGIHRVSSAGGTPEMVLDRAADEHSLCWPEILPDGDTLLFGIYRRDEKTLNSGAVVPAVVHEIGVLSLGTDKRKTLGSGMYPRYAPTGHLLYRSSDQNHHYAVRFDLSRLDSFGDPVVLSEAGQWPLSLSRNGTLAYFLGDYGFSLVSVDHQGETKSVKRSTDLIGQPRFSPDGKVLALSVVDSGSAGIWIYDIERGILAPLTLEYDGFPTWTPDGTRIVFTSRRKGKFDIFWMPSDGSGEAELLAESELSQHPTSWSPTEDVLLFQEGSLKSGRDVWVLRLGGEPKPFLSTQFDEGEARFSPDGRWIALSSDRSGQHEIYVVAYPELGRMELISNGGGIDPVWSPDGTQLFYRSGDNMMAVPTQIDSTFSAGTPRLLFGWAPNPSMPLNYDIAPDGRSFAMIRRSNADSIRVVVVFNWFEELKRLLPMDQ